MLQYIVCTYVHATLMGKIWLKNKNIKMEEKSGKKIGGIFEEVKKDNEFDQMHFINV